MTKEHSGTSKTTTCCCCWQSLLSKNTGKALTWHTLDHPVCRVRQPRLQPTIFIQQDKTGLSGWARLGRVTSQEIASIQLA